MSDPFKSIDYESFAKLPVEEAGPILLAHLYARYAAPGAPNPSSHFNFEQVMSDLRGHPGAAVPGWIRPDKQAAAYVALGEAMS